VIAQIKLLQSACNSYCLSPEPAFLRWFKSQLQLSEEERYTASHVLRSRTSTLLLAVMVCWTYCPQSDNRSFFGSFLLAALCSSDVASSLPY